MVSFWLRPMTRRCIFHTDKEFDEDEWLTPLATGAIVKYSVTIQH